MILEQVFLVSSPIGVGYSGTYGHTNKWIVIGRNDMEDNGIRIDMTKKLDKSMTKKSDGPEDKLVFPRRKIPIIVNNERMFNTVQQIEVQE